MKQIQKALKQNTIIQIVLGVILVIFYKMYQKKDSDIVVEIPELIITKGQNEVSKVQYFTEKEFFKSGNVIQSLLPNWEKLKIELNKIRTAFGYPIIITQGYKANEYPYNMAKGVLIYPENHDYTTLWERVMLLHNGNDLKGIKEIKQLQNKAIYVEIV